MIGDFKFCAIDFFFWTTHMWDLKKPGEPIVRNVAVYLIVAAVHSDQWRNHENMNRAESQTYER